MNRFKIVLMASLLVQGVACLEAKADNTPEGNKTNSKALGVNAVSGKVTNEQGGGFAWRGGSLRKHECTD